jgi:hypothetical protein
MRFWLWPKLVVNSRIYDIIIESQVALSYKEQVNMLSLEAKTPNEKDVAILMHVTIDLQLISPHWTHTLEWNDYSKFNHVNMFVGLPYFYFQTLWPSQPHKLHKYFLLFRLTTLQVQMQGRSIASLDLFQYANSVCMPTLIIRCLGCYAY